MYACLLLVIALRLKQNLNPDPNPKFCDFPNLAAQILPKLRIILVKLFSCDQNFSSVMQIQLHTDYSALMLTEKEYIASVQSIIRGTAWQTY